MEILQWVAPFVVALSGSLIYWQAGGHLTDLQSYSIRATANVFWWILTPFVSFMVYALRVEKTNEATALLIASRKLKPEPEPVVPSGWNALAYETTTTYRTRALGLEGPKLRAVAAALVAGFPFSEDYLADKSKIISARECRAFKAKCLDRGLARWQDERHHTKGIEMTPERVEDTWKVLARGGLKVVGTPPPQTQITAPTR